MRHKDCGGMFRTVRNKELRRCWLVCSKCHHIIKGFAQTRRIAS